MELVNHIMPISHHRLADAELGRILNYLDRESPNKRIRFAQAIKDVQNRILGNPALGAPIFNHYRWMRVGRFKWFIYYRQFQSDNIVVYAIAHGSRRPGYWLRRSKKP